MILKKRVLNIRIPIVSSKNNPMTFNEIERWIVTTIPKAHAVFFNIGLVFEMRGTIKKNYVFVDDTVTW